jgi:malonate decarboxylase beta subunit
LALDDKGVNVNAMSKKSAAYITKRSLNELEAAVEKVPGIAYDISSFDKLGAVSVLLERIHADNPERDDVERVKKILIKEIERAESGGSDLRFRLTSAKAKTGRTMSIKVREELLKQWNT